MFSIILELIKPGRLIIKLGEQHGYMHFNAQEFRYRNPYQTRQLFASMRLSAGENIMWVATQMGHVDTEKVMRTYGKWVNGYLIIL